nr:PREDICTED: adhesion G-protein coupled receptor G4 [Anolis carolinensis]|eukprot:XP_008119695.2 PREDICTED: adhesion G-protein coupled receptor G4 [Anolis carolinensis]
MGGQGLRVAGICPPKFLCILLITAAALLILATGESSTSLKEKQLDYRMQRDKYVFLDGHPERELCSFTVCIDIKRTDANLATWPAFSYDVNGSSEDFRKAELALSMNKSILQVFILGSVVEVKQDLPAFKMHRLCCIWDGAKSLLEIFHHGSKVNTTTVHNVTHKCLRPRGTLALGRLHKNQDGIMVPEQLFTFTGILHYFQMWASVRDQQKMTSCDRGDVISWQDSYWHLNGIKTESAHNQHCGKEEVTPPLPSKTPESSATETFYRIRMESSMSFPSLEMFDYYDAMDLLRKLASSISPAYVEAGWFPNGGWKKNYTHELQLPESI